MFILFDSLFGQAHISTAIKNCASDGRASASHERDPIRNTGHQNVHLGETVRGPSRQSETVSEKF